MNVIFACIHNAGRSQMAAAFFNKYADQAKAQAFSAGTQPAEKVHDCVLAAMKKVDIDLTGVKPQLLTDHLAIGANLLITMGCGEACPYVPGLKRDDWPFPDPKGKTDDEVCEIRDQIKARVLRLLHDLNALECCNLEASKWSPIKSDHKDVLHRASSANCRQGFSWSRTI